MNDYSDHPALDFLDEEPTDPFLPVTVQVARAELDSATSVVGEILGRAQAHGYRTDAPRHWTERLELDLERARVGADEVSLIVDTI